MNKKLFPFLYLFLLVLCSCEDVVEVELQENPPRLVVDASLLWRKGAPGNDHTIRLTTTAPYFEEDVPPAMGATVSVTDVHGRKFIFEEVAPGIYRNENFISSFGNPYELKIEYDGESYLATEEFIPTPALEYVVQTNNGGFGGDNTELRVFYTDPGEMDNYYFFRFLHESLSIQIYDDEFTNGNLTFAFFSEEDLDPGEEVGFEIQGISRRFYNYMFILRSQSGNGGGPFQTQPTTVRGNVVNITNPDNFALGYFRMSEIDYLSYTVE